MCVVGGFAMSRSTSQLGAISTARTRQLRSDIGDSRVTVRLLYPPVKTPVRG